MQKKDFVSNETTGVVTVELQATTVNGGGLLGPSQNKRTSSLSLKPSTQPDTRAYQTTVHDNWRTTLG